MGYITRQRVYPIKKDDNVPPMMSPRTQTELEIHYYCDQCGSWGVTGIEARPESEMVLGCAKYTVLGLLLGGIAFWPLWILALVFIGAIIGYEKKIIAKNTDFHRCNQCGFVWDQNAILDPNPRGYGYNDYMVSE